MSFNVLEVLLGLFGVVVALLLANDGGQSLDLDLPDHHGLDLDLD